MIKDLAGKLENCQLCLEEERFEDIDFDELKSILKNACETLVYLEEKKDLCNKLLLDFKGEMMKMSLAISKAKGEGNISSSLTEKFILSDLSFEEMVGLRKHLKDELNRNFHTSPKYQTKNDIQKSKVDTALFKA